MLQWDVAIYALNDQARLRACLDSVARSLEGLRARIAVILSGSRDGSGEIARRAARDGLPVEVYRIEAADPSNAINQFFYHIRRPAQAVAGVDGDTHVGPDSFPAMLARLDQRPGVVATSGICLGGRTMARATASILSRGGQLHGKLHGLRGSFVDRMVDRGIRLPIGTYGTGSLLCSMAAHDLDPLNQPWADSRVEGVAGATFTVPALSPLRPRDLLRHVDRRTRQMTGRLQTAAMEDVIYRDGFDALPDHADEMVRSFLATNPPPPMTGMDRWFQRLALRRLRAATAPIDPVSLMPHRLAA